MNYKDYPVSNQHASYSSTNDEMILVINYKYLNDVPEALLFRNELNAIHV